MSKTKIIVQSSRLDDSKAKNAAMDAMARPSDFQIDSDDLSLSGKTKVRESKQSNDNKIYLEFPRGSTTSKRIKHPSRVQSQKVSMNAQMRVDRGSRTKTRFLIDRTVSSDQQDPARNPEDDLDLKVKDFLRKAPAKGKSKTFESKSGQEENRFFCEQVTLTKKSRKKHC